jgi:integrase
MARKRYQYGSLFQRGKRHKVWVGRWWEDAIGPDGQLRRVRRAEILGPVAELRTRRQAEHALSDRLRPINSGKHSPHGTQRFADFVERQWLPVVLPTFKYATQKSYRYLLGVHLVPAFGELGLAEISRERAQAFLNAKLGGGLSWQTVHHLRCALSRVLGSAEEWGYVPENPIRKTKLPRQVRRRASAAVAPEQIRKLLANLPEPSRSLVILLAATGLRIGELLALRWRNVDFTKGLLRVDETVYEGHFDEPKSVQSIRSVPLGPYALALLRARAEDNGHGHHDALVFSSRNGTALDRRTLLRRQLKPVCRALAMPVISWHTLRHANATLLDAVGTPLGTVQELLGHSSSEITRQVYLHSIPEDQRRAVKKVDRLLFGPKTDSSRVVRQKGSSLIQ